MMTVSEIRKRILSALLCLEHETDQSNRLVFSSVLSQLSIVVPALEDHARRHGAVACAHTKGEFCNGCFRKI